MKWVHALEVMSARQHALSPEHLFCLSPNRLAALRVIKYYVFRGRGLMVAKLLMYISRHQKKVNGELEVRKRTPCYSLGGLQSRFERFGRGTEYFN
jgi:hypothetical protein